MTDINATYQRTDIGDWPTAADGQLPEQMGGVRSTLLPGIDVFKLPANLSQLWTEFETEDTRQFLPTGQPNPTHGQKIKRVQLKLDRNNPLIVVGGKHDGEPMTANFSTNPRPRGKKDDQKTAWISDLQYLIFNALGDKTMPKTIDETKAVVNKYAGREIRLEHGLSGQCRPDKVRYIRILLDGVEQDMLDPAGTKGCGARYYTKDFKDAESNTYITEIAS